MESTVAVDPPQSETDNHKNQRNNTSTVVDVDLDWSEMTEEALRRMQQFLRTSLSEEPPEVAALHVSSALFHKALFQMDRAVDEALRHCQDPIDRIEGLARAIDVMLRIARQIDRFGQLRTLLLEARQTLPERARS